MRKSKPKESVLQKKVTDYIRSNYKHSVTFKVEKSSVDGTPDFFFTIPIFGPGMIEFKRDITCEPRPNQVSMIARLNKGDCPTFVVHTFEEWMSIKAIIDSVILARKV